MSVTAETVKALRERTGAGMMECKKALIETGGDLDAAAEVMRKAGDAYNRTRLTPAVKALFTRWLAFRRS